MELTLGHFLVLFVFFVFVILPTYGKIVDRICKLVEDSESEYWKYTTIGLFSLLTIAGAMLVIHSIGLVF
ncbi:MAG: hypothetical protein R3230_00275 [Nitrosopumilaceae archaeon]|nr:hypothetical protein [Nitrosopumilaceae archaeon]